MALREHDLQGTHVCEIVSLVNDYAYHVVVSALAECILGKWSSSVLGVVLEEGLSIELGFWNVGLSFLLEDFQVEIDEVFVVLIAIKAVSILDHFLLFDSAEMAEDTSCLMLVRRHIGYCLE